MSDEIEVRPLDEDERARLSSCEEVIAEGLGVFIAVGRSLTQIRKERLYRETHRNFEEYCLETWGMAKSRAYQLIEAVVVVDNVHNCGRVPENEAQTRELTKLPPEKQAEAWTKAVETAPKGKVTAKHIEAVVATMQPADAPANPVLLRMQNDPKFAAALWSFNDPKALGGMPDDAAIPRQLISQYPKELADLENVGALRRVVAGAGTPRSSRVRRPKPQRAVSGVGTTNSPPSPSGEPHDPPNAETPVPNAVPDADEDTVTPVVVAFRESLTTLYGTFSLVPDDFLDLVRLHQADATMDEFLEALGARAARHEAQIRYDALPQRKSKEGNDLRKELNAADAKYDAFVARIVKRSEES